MYIVFNVIIEYGSRGWHIVCLLHFLRRSVGEQLVVGANVAPLQVCDVVELLLVVIPGVGGTGSIVSMSLKIAQVRISAGGRFPVGLITVPPYL